MEKALEDTRVQLTEITFALIGVTGNVTKQSIQFAECRAREQKILNAIRSRRGALGVNDEVNLLALRSSAYLRARLNARALKQRLRTRLRQRKFEIEKLERSYRKTVNGKSTLMK